ncbi:MAG: PilZ domain-containing protein [Nitrospirota bacterium]
MDFPGAERRVDTRSHVLVTRAKIGDERKYFFGYARDVSRSGVFVKIVTPKSPGEVFQVEFTLPRADFTIKCNAEVVWSRSFPDADNKEPGMGMRFIDLDPLIQDKIDEWVQREREQLEEE